MLAQVERTRNTRTLKNGGLPTCTDSQTDANYFFWAAGVATLGTGLLPIKLNFLVNIGAIDLFKLYGGGVGALKLYGAFGAWLVVLAALGLAARRSYRFAFLLGHDSVWGRHDHPHSHVFIVGLRGPRVFRVSLVPGAESAERSSRSERFRRSVAQVANLVA
jgi:hypothetical protein